MSKEKKPKAAPSSFRFTVEAEGLLQIIAESFGGNRTAALEWIIRQEAKRRKIEAPDVQ